MGSQEGKEESLDFVKRFFEQDII